MGGRKRSGNGLREKRKKERARRRQISARIIVVNKLFSNTFIH